MANQTAWVNGSKVTGTMTNRGTWNGTCTTNGSVTIPGGYHSGSGKVSNSQAKLAGGTYTPSGSSQTISCNGKLMTSNVVINAIPSSYVNLTSGGTVFRNGSFGTAFSSKFNLTKTPIISPNNSMIFQYNGSYTISLSRTHSIFNTVTSGSSTYAKYTSNGIELVVPAKTSMSSSYLSVILANAIKVGTGGASKIVITFDLVIGDSNTGKLFEFGLIDSTKTKMYAFEGKKIGNSGNSTQFIITMNLSSIPNGYYWFEMYGFGRYESAKNGYIIKSIVVY